jgi:hypothetical protein
MLILQSILLTVGTKQYESYLWKFNGSTSPGNFVSTHNNKKSINLLPIVPFLVKK